VSPRTRRAHGKHAGGVTPSFVVVFLAYIVLCIYLFGDQQIQGDGAAYSLQALDGSPWDRSIHVGALAPLWFGVQIVGLPPNLLGVFWTGVGLLASCGIGGRILALHPRSPQLGPGGLSLALGTTLGPLSMMAAAITWKGALFVEIYAPLSALLLLAVWAVLAARPWLAGIALAWAAATHPGAWGLVPGLLLLTPGRSLRDWIPTLGLAALAHSVTLTLLYPDWWNGGRGLADLPPSDQNFWPALQSLWRLLADDLGIAALPVILALPLLNRRQLTGLGLVILGSAAALCRYSDNAGGLPALWLLLAFSPLALRAVEEVELRRLRVGLTILGGFILLFGVGDATSVQDAERRRANREHEARVAQGCPGPEQLPWSEAQLWALSCREGGAQTP